MKDNFSRKAAIEMSMTTIVTIVLVVVTLVLALVLIRTIFTGSTNAITSVNTEIQNQINQLFTSNDNANLIVYPNGGQFNVKRGDTPHGFAFSIKNPEKTMATFNYTLAASDVHNCGSGITLSQANNYILGSTGQFQVGPGDISNALSILFDVPQSAPPCTIIYGLQVTEVSPGQSSFPANIFVTIQ